MIAIPGEWPEGNPRDAHVPMDGRGKGRLKMARIELADITNATLGEAPAADTFFELGMMYSVGRSVPVDYVVAHKWFNLAALRGNDEAVRLRQEIAAQMSEAEIASAQRAARAWLKGLEREHFRPIPVRATAECRAP
jgi:TPR repeat protein